MIDNQIDYKPPVGNDGWLFYNCKRSDLKLRKRIDNDDGVNGVEETELDENDFVKDVSQKGSKATNAVAITPDDANDLATTPTEGLYIGVTGDVKVDMIDGSTVTFTALKGGIVYPYSVSRVYATGTTATDIVALY